MSTTHSPPDLVPKISSGALPQTPASKWADDMHDILAAHVTRTPVDPSVVSGSENAPDDVGHEPTPHRHSMPFSTTAHAGHSAVDLSSADPGDSAPISVPESPPPAPHRDSTTAQRGHSSTGQLAGAPKTSESDPRDDSVPLSIAAQTGHSSIDLRVPESPPHHDSLPFSTTAHTGHSSFDLISADPGVSVPIESLPPAPHRDSTTAHTRRSSTDLPVDAPNTSGSAPRPDSVPFSITAHTGHSSVDLRVPVSPPRHDSIPLSTTAHTGHSSRSSFSLPFPSSSSANAHADEDLLSELSLEFIRRAEGDGGKGEGPPRPHRVSTPLSTTADTGHSVPAPVPSGSPSRGMVQAHVQLVQSPDAISQDAQTDGDAQIAGYMDANANVDGRAEEKDEHCCPFKCAAAECVHRDDVKLAVRAR
ncbi:hypothetical protein B0H12DRAFT_106121 [Mycena haematopus]|nr:hypothetical protein B0H12DRAFT_106121 [Mycena haematopus]